MKRLITICAFAACLVLITAKVEAGITYTIFSDQASFLAATYGGSGLAFEDFEGFADITLQTLDSTTNYPPISPGDIPAGVVFSSTGGTSKDLCIAPPGFKGLPAIVSDSLFANYYYTPLIVDFDPGITAVGSDVISWDTGSTIRITLRDVDGDTYLEATTPTTDMPSHFGLVTTGGEIVRVEYTPGDLTAGIDNIHFGQPIPEPGTLLLLGLGAVILRRKR
jgi:hypothetical protein